MKKKWNEARKMKHGGWEFPEHYGHFLAPGRCPTRDLKIDNELEATQRLVQRLEWQEDDPGGRVPSSRPRLWSTQQREWTADHLDALQEMWLAGRPLAGIADWLGATRNVVLGQAQRIGLPPRGLTDLSGDDAL